MTTANEVLVAIDQINAKGGIALAKRFMQEYAAELKKQERKPEWKIEKKSCGWAVGFYGWGSAEDDLFFTSCETAEEAIQEAMDHHQKGWWVPSCYDDETRAFVYELVEDSTWVRSGWSKE